MKGPPTNYSIGGNSPSPEQLPYILRTRSVSPLPFVQQGTSSPSPEQDYSVRERTPPPQRSSSIGLSDAVSPDPSIDHMEFAALPEIEVAPSIYKELRGSKETIYAIEHGYATTTGCPCCGDKLKCLADVEMVICPDCRVVSRLDRVDEDDAYGRNLPFRPPRGVGLGLKLSLIVSK